MNPNHYRKIYLNGLDLYRGIISNLLVSRLLEYVLMVFDV